jgi:hypothetical protein
MKIQSKAQELTALNSAMLMGRVTEQEYYQKKKAILSDSYTADEEFGIEHWNEIAALERLRYNGILTLEEEEALTRRVYVPVRPQPSPEQPPDVGQAPSPYSQPHYQSSPHGVYGANPQPSQSLPQYGNATHQYTTQSRTPALDAWKTSTGTSVLGFIGYGLINSLGRAQLYSIQNNYDEIDIINIIHFVVSVLSIVYALFIYPSYFKAKPFLKNNKAISFFNLFFGSVIFGLIWNGNLTKRKKGVSHIVSVVVSIVLWFVSSFVMGEIYG